MDVDAKVGPSQLTIAAVHELAQLEPYGEGNREPVYLLPSVRIEKTQLVGTEKQHLKLQISTKTNEGGQEKVTNLDAIAFRAADLADMFVPGSLVDMLVEPAINIWNGEETLSLHVQDMHFMNIGRMVWDQPQTLENLYRNRLGLSKIAVVAKCREQDLLPTREEMGLLYRFLEANCKEATNIIDLSYLARLVTGRFKKPLHAFKISRALDIFTEAGLLEMLRIGDARVCFTLLSVKDKVKLEDTKTYQALFPKTGE